MSNPILRADPENQVAGALVKRFEQSNRLRSLDLVLPVYNNAKKAFSLPDSKEVLGATAGAARIAGSIPTVLE